MAKLSILAGSTSQTINVFIKSSSNGGVTGLAYNASGLTAVYVLPQQASASISLSALGSATASWFSGGWFEIDSTHCPGLYRLDIPNAALASGSGRFVTIVIQGASGMVPCVIETELTGTDNQNSVNFGLSAIPNAAASAAGGLLTYGNGSGQLSPFVGGVNVMQWSAHNVGVDSVHFQPIVSTGYFGSQAVTLDSNNLLNVNVQDWKSSAIGFPATAGVPDVNVKNWNSQVAQSNGSNLPSVDVASFANNAVQLNSFDVPIVDMTYFRGNVAASTNAGYPDVNLVHIAGAAVSTSSAQIGSNVVSSSNIDFTANQKTSLNNSTPASITGSVASVTGNVGGNVAGSVASVTGNVGGNVAGSVASVTAPISVAGDFSATMKTSLGTAVGTAQSGDSYARLGAGGVGLTDIGDARMANLNAPVDGCLTPSGTLAAVTTCTNLTNAPTSGDLTATMKSSVAAAVPSASAVAAATAGYQGTESYAANTSVPTLLQLLFMIWSALTQFSISGETITATKLDGETTAMTFTTNSATAPTSRVRAS